MMTKHSIKVTKMWLRTISPFLIMLTVTCGMLLAPQVTVQVMAGPENSKPVAVIDGTLSVYIGDIVYLDGTWSSDPEGNALSFTWTLESSPEGSLSIIIDSSDAQASFEADVVGTYKVKLVVNNGFVDSAPVYGTITVTKQPYRW